MEWSVISEADTMIVLGNNILGKTETTRMKYSKSDVRGKVGPGLGIRFEPQGLTSHSGPVVLRHLLPRLDIRERLWGCFRHPRSNPIYGRHVVMMLLVVHLIVGHRRLRDMDFHRDDEMIRRIPGPEQLPDVSTVSRFLVGADGKSVAKVRRESRYLVMERLTQEKFSRVTLDYDGSMLVTGVMPKGW